MTEDQPTDDVEQEIIPPKPKRKPGRPFGSKRSQDGRSVKQQVEFAVEKALGLKHKGRGRPEHEPSKESRAMVTLLSSMDFTKQQILKYLDLDRKTLDKHYEKEIEHGKTMLDVQALSALFVNIQAKKEKSVIFYLASRVPGFMPDPGALYGTMPAAVPESSSSAAQIEHNPQSIHEADALYESVRK